MSALFGFRSAAEENDLIARSNFLHRELSFRQRNQGPAPKLEE